MGHQRAAFEFLTYLYTPQSAMQTPLGRMVVAWYARFDVFVGLMGGFPTALPREWFTAFVDYCQAQVATASDNIRWKVEERAAQFSLVSMDMSMLFARGSRGEISAEAFAAEHDQLSKRLEDWKANWDPALTDPSHLVTEFPQERLLGGNDIVNPFARGVLYDLPLFSTTMATAAWHSIMVMHKCQSSTMPKEQLYAELASHSYAICQIFEAVELWPPSPKGALITIQACVAIAALFLPQDSRHHMWVRRRFALLETMG
jgi:hypothetical protein